MNGTGESTPGGGTDRASHLRNSSLVACQRSAVFSMGTGCCHLTGAVSMLASVYQAASHSLFNITPLFANAAATYVDTRRCCTSVPPSVAVAGAAITTATEGDALSADDKQQRRRMTWRMAPGKLHGGLSKDPRPAEFESGCRRSRVLVKVPSADSRALPDVSLHALQPRLQAANPSLHVQRLSVRSGCIILELDITGTERLGGPRTEGNSRASLPSDAEWLELLNVRGIASDELGNGPMAVSVLINDQVTQLRYSAETSTWVRTSAASTALQLRPQCLTLDRQLTRLSLRGRGVAADGNKVEAVCAGRPLPCTVVSRFPGAGDEDEVVLEVALSTARPGLVQCNVWGRMEPVSCLVATLPVLLLPSGCAEAAGQLTWIAAVDDSTDVFMDLGELLNQTSAMEGQPSASVGQDQGQPSLVAQQQRPEQPPVECLEELAGSAAELLVWCQQAGYEALAHVVADAADQLDQLLALEQRSSSAGTTFSVHTADSAAAGAAPEPPYDITPAHLGAGPHQPGSRFSLQACWAALQRLDTAPHVGRGSSSALPTQAWTAFVMLVYLLGFCRSVASGQRASEAIALALTALPYTLILGAYATGAVDMAGRGGGAGAAAGGSRARAAAAARARASGGGAAPATRVSLARWLTRNSRLCLHVYRCLLAALMGLGYLPVPLVMKISLARPMAGISYPLKMLYMVMEAYDWRAATLSLVFLDTPATYLLMGHQKVQCLFKHLATLAWLGTAVQWLMFCLHSSLASSAARAVSAGSSQPATRL